MQKYALLHAQVAAMPGIDLRSPSAASFEELCLAHDEDYVRRVFDGALSATEAREIGFPWSEAMLERSRRSVGATIAAARCALQEGIAVNLAGGTHHALAGRGGGFCVFNDVAVAIRVLQQERQIATALIVDLDVHQGNGSASIFGNDDSVFTLSLHGEKNFPFRKEKSDLDVGLADGLEDGPYLHALGEALGVVQQRFKADILFYLAGADVHENDRLGRLALTHEGMRQRDEMVFQFAAQHALPVAVAMAGGYGKDIGETVKAHAQTNAIAKRHADARHLSFAATASSGVDAGSS
jgi:acetoin utilization deacetylase AcuC-like enzyme